MPFLYVNMFYSIKNELKQQIIDVNQLFGL